MTAHADHRSDDSGMVRICGDTVDEGPIYFQRVNRVSLEMVQARVSGTEVIESEVKTHCLEGVKHLEGRWQFRHQEQFRQLEFEELGLQACRGEHPAHELDEVLRPQLRRGYVD